MDWPQALGALELSSLSLLGPRYSTLETSLLVLERRLAGNNATRPTSAGGPLHKLHALLALCPPPSSLAGEQRHQHAREPALAPPGAFARRERACKPAHASASQPHDSGAPCLLTFEGPRAVLVVLFFCFNRIGLMLGLFPWGDGRPAGVVCLVRQSGNPAPIWTSATRTPR